MTGIRHPYLLCSCAAAILAAGFGVPCGPAQAQTLRPAITTDGPFPPLRPTKPARPGTQPVTPEDTPVIRPSRGPIAEPPGALDVEDDEAEPQPPTGLRPAARDGAPDQETGPVAEVDGPEGEQAPYENPDGSNSVAWDARSPEDVAVIERPPAGYDPELHRAELSPLTDRRPERLYRFEPWQPRGIRVGSFTAFPVVEVGGAWVSNLFRTQPARPDQAFELRPALRLVSNWRTQALELRAVGGFTYFDNYPGEDDRAYQLEARGRVDVSRRTNLTGVVQRDVYQEPRGTLEQRLRGGPRADVTTDQAGLDLRHQFNRLSLGMRASVLTREVANTTAPDGSQISNRDRDVTATEQAVRTTWTFKPTVQAFAEVATNQRDYRAAPVSDGISRNSTGERYRAGIGFGNTGQILRGEVSLGWGQQRPDAPQLGAIDGVLVDANLAWRIDGMNALLLRANTDVVETSLAGSPGGFLRRGSIEWRHAFLKPLIGTAAFGYAATSYESSAIEERLADVALGLEYYLAPEALIFTRWQHLAYRTTAATGNWDGDEIRVGLRLRQ